MIGLINNWQQSNRSSADPFFPFFLPSGPTLQSGIGGKNKKVTVSAYLSNNMAVMGFSQRSCLYSHLCWQGKVARNGWVWREKGTTEARPINSLVADKSLLNIPPPLPVQCPSPGRLACLRKISLEGEVGDTFFSKSVCIHYTELVHKPITWTKTEECNGESISFWVPCRGKAQFSPSQLDNLGKLCCLPLTIVFLSVKAGMPLISM